MQLLKHIDKALIDYLEYYNMEKYYENQILSFENACRLIKELKSQKYVIDHNEYMYKLFPENNGSTINLEEGECAVAYCKSAFNYFIENDDDFEKAMNTKKHHPITGAYRIGVFSKDEDILIDIDDVVPFYDRIWCITRSAGVLYEKFKMIGNTSQERALKIYPPCMPFPSEPMIGFVGTEPKKESYSSGRGNSHGGNLDLPCIKKGSKVILPSVNNHPGVWFGDIHAKQGWGEIAGTALECSGMVKFRMYKVQLFKKAQEPIVIVPKPDNNGYEIYFVGCRNTFTNALSAAVKNAVKFYPIWNTYGFIDAYRELGFSGNVYVGQARGKTISIAIKIEIEDINTLFINGKGVF
ncbi:MAG: acetamidase/formamidase family protein [Deltaproteobacteria bacterium]